MSIKKISLDKVIAKYNELVSKAKTPGTEQKLKNIHEVCQKITSSGGTVSPPAIIKYLSTKGIIISPRTLYYNKKEKNGEIRNLYRILIDEWIDHSTTVNNINLTAKDLNAPLPELLVEDNDLAKIEDLTLRHKMALMLGEVKGLRNQVNTLREIRTNPTLSLSKPLAELSYEESLEFSLDEDDIEMLKQLLKISKTSNLGFGDGGELKALKVIKRDEIFSDFGLKETIEKIVNLHTPPSL